MWLDSPPTPTELQRELLVSGEWLRFEDEHQWLAPKARRWSEDNGQLTWEHNLPTALDMADDGHLLEAGPKPKYQKLWQLAMRYDQADMDAAARGLKVFDFPDALETVALALQVNYRVSMVELVMLGVLDNGPMRDAVLSVLIDRERQVAFWKKKLANDQDSVEANTGNGSSGQAEEIHTMPQPSQT